MPTQLCCCEGTIFPIKHVRGFREQSKGIAKGIKHTLLRGLLPSLDNLKHLLLSNSSNLR